MYSNLVSTWHVFLVSILRFASNDSTLKYRCLFKIKHRIMHMYLSAPLSKRTSKSRNTEKESTPRENWSTLQRHGSNAKLWLHYTKYGKGCGHMYSVTHPLFLYSVAHFIYYHAWKQHAMLSRTWVFNHSLCSHFSLLVVNNVSNERY